MTPEQLLEKYRHALSEFDWQEADVNNLFITGMLIGHHTDNGIHIEEKSFTRLIHAFKRL